MNQRTANIVRSRCPITATPRIKLINLSREANSPDEDAHIIPETHLEQENFRRRLIATARSLKKQKQRLKAEQNTLNNRWNKVLDNEEKYGGVYHTKSYPKRKLLP